VSGAPPPGPTRTGEREELLLNFNVGCLVVANEARLILSSH